MANAADSEAPRRSVCDTLGDCAMAVIDEGKFWVEVFTEFMEWDEEGRQKWADEQMDSMKDHIDDMRKIEEDAKKVRFSKA